MWYREAQNSNMTYRWQTTEKGDALVISSNKTKDGFEAQPAIFILFEIKGLNEDIPFKKENLNQTEIISIFQTVQNELFKYPPGWISERLGNNFQIQIVLDLEKTNESQTQGYTPHPGKYVVLRKDGISYAIDHEIAHALDMKRIGKLPLMNFDKNHILEEFLLDQKDGTYMSPTEYGKNSNAEAFAEAYKVLAKNGIKFRYPETTKQSIDQNRLLDYVEKYITSGNYKTKLVDFGNNIQLNVRKRMKSVFDNPSSVLDNQRIQTIVGGFQNAIDRFDGDKQKYGTSLIQDKQKIKDIVEYLNNTQSEFFTSPASDEEIKLALDYLKEKIDKKDFIQKRVIDKRREVVQNGESPLTLKFAPKAIVDILDWMGKSTNIKKTPGNKYFVNVNGRNMPLSTQLTQLLDNYFKNGSRENLMPLNEDQSRRLDDLREIFKKNDPNFQIRNIAQSIYDLLIYNGGVFPPGFSNPEEFLFYDYKITPNGYVLDTNSVERKIKNVIIKFNNEFQIPENQKPFVEQQVMKMIQSHAVEYKKLLDYKERDPKNPFPIEFIKNKFTPVNYFDLAKKAIAKIINTYGSFLNPDTKSIKFLRIYNSDFFNASQKQELLNFYRSEQAKPKYTRVQKQY